VDFLLSDDQAALQSELRRFLRARVDHDVRSAAATLPGAVDRSLWAELAAMGVFGIHTQEDDEGVGLGLAEAVIVFEELGRVAAPGPTISTCLAATLGVEGAADGTNVVGLIRADTLLVEHLEGLDTLLVHHDGLVETVTRPSGTLLPRPLDPLTPVSQVEAIPAGDEISTAGERIIQEGRLLAAAFQVGLGQAAVDLGTDYAGQRQQFGKAIGSFQAVKHLLADAVVGVDIARAGVHAAAVALDEDEPSGRSMSVDAARMVASHAAQRASEACIQVHGGIGFTWELDAHLFLKRSLALDATFGTVHASADAVAATL
jgi:alkylation response protein AidB-like acyl-CoA dehydrogenase